MNRHNIFFALVSLFTLNAISPGLQEVPRPPIPIENVEVGAMDETAFIDSLRNDNTELARAALVSGLDANLESPSGHNALSIVAIENRPQLIQLLLDFGADIDQVSHSAPALVYATSLNHSDCVESLLTAGADPDVPSADGKTALHYAAMLGHSELVGNLTGFGASLNASDNEGNTPLVLATANRHLGVVEWLLNQGADRDLRNGAGENAFEIASAIGASEIANLLSQQPTFSTIDEDASHQLIRDEVELIKALANVSPGDVLQLAPGTYDGEFVLTEAQVTILGDPNGGTVIRNSLGKQDFVFYVRGGSQVLFQNVRFAFDGPQQVGLYSDGNDIELRDCGFDGATHHACFGVDSQFRLYKCRFENLSQIGLYARGSSSVEAKQCVFSTGKRTAIQLESGARGELKECRFENVAAASILAVDASQLIVNHCHFEKTNQAISVEKLARDLSILDCRFENYKTAVQATSVQGRTRLIKCDFLQSKDSLASYVENGDSTLMARNKVLGGQFAFNIQGRFGAPVSLAKNWISDTVKGAIFVKANSSDTESPVIRLSRNLIVAQTGYGVLLEAASPAVFAQNRILVAESMAVSLQRGSAAVFNDNCIFSNDFAVNLFETDAVQTSMMREQIYGPLPAALEDRMTTDLLRRLSYVTGRAESVEAIRICVRELLANVRKGSDVSGFEQTREKLENQIRADRETSETLIPVSLTIEDKAGKRRRGGFKLFESESAAAGVSRLVPSDLRDTAALLERLGDANSPFLRLSKWANRRSPGNDGADGELGLLAMLNQQLEDPTLYVTSRFEGIVDPQFVEHIKQLGSLEEQDAETIRWVNRRLLEQTFPDLIAASAPIGVSNDRPLFVPPGRFWIVSNANQNLIQSVRIGPDNGEVVVVLPQSIWLAIQPRDQQPLRWKLFQVRKPKQVKYELEHLRPRITTLKSVLRSDATKDQIANAREAALGSLDSAILPLNDAKRADPTLDSSKQFEIARYVRQILALTGNAADAKLIVKRLNNGKDTINVLLWLETVAHIESRVGNLKTGELARLAKTKNEAKLAASAAIQLHLMGVTQADDVIRQYLKNPVDRVFAERAAWTLLDDRHEETRVAMLSFHNQLMLDMEKDRWERWKTIPTTLYLLGHGKSSDLRFLSVTPMTAIHLKWMAPLLADPLQAAQVLIDIHNFDGARDLATSFLNRQGGDVLYHELIAAIIATMQSNSQSRIQQLAMAYRGKMESEIYCSFFRPSETAAKLLGGFDDTENKFVDLRAWGEFSIGMQSVVTWNADRKQLDQYVRNWQAGHNNYIEKLDYFSLEEIEASLDRVGGAKPSGYELFKIRHLIASSRGISRRDYFPYGIDRRGYILGQPKADEEYPGSINGVLEVKVERHQAGTRIWIRHLQDAYFDQLGTLASTIGSHSKPEHWPIFRYLENDGRALIQSIQLRKGDQRIELVETGESKDGFRAFDVDVSDPALGEHYLDLSLNFFGREQTLSYALHSGEIGRVLRRNR